MRLFLLPISTRHTLLYCERLPAVLPNPNSPSTAPKPPLTDRITSKAATTWSDWERRDRGWQKAVTNYGNQLFKRIPYQEWGLKTLPPLTKARREALSHGEGESGLALQVHYPRRFLRVEGKGEEGVRSLLRRLATERQALSMKRMWQAVALMPATLPVAVLPVIPNLPFFYLVFRAWSHYRALYGGRFLDLALEAGRVRLVPSESMDEIYSMGLTDKERKGVAGALGEEEMDKVAGGVWEGLREGEDRLLVRRWNGKLIAESFGLPEMEVEIERAVEQVEREIEAGKGKEGEGASREKGAVVEQQELGRDKERKDR
ncbi:hypothetical protein MBLNU230_g5070t1 [Neophaeotheca triangularis]